MKTLSIILLGFWSLASAAEPLVTNVRAAQQQGTKLVDVWYDVSGVSTAVYVGLQISSNSGSTFAVPATALSGDLGSSVPPGRNKHIVWNAGTDWNSQLSTTIRFRVAVSNTPPSVVLSDDFNDNSISGSLWTSSGNTVIESGQIMQVLSTVTDQWGVLTSKPIPLSSSGSVMVTRNVRLHDEPHMWGSDTHFFMAETRLNFGSLAPVVIRYCHMDYESPPNYKAMHGIYICRNNANPHNPNYAGYDPNDISTWISPLWDTWFKETIVYNPQSGNLAYSINDVPQTTFNVGIMPVAASPSLVLSFNPAAWWTGHEHLIDNLQITQEVGSLTPPAVSSNVTVDTRTLAMTQLVVSGPSSIPRGQEGTYTAMLNYQGAAAEDVTSQCEWFVSGGPPVTFWLDKASMNGNVLSPQVVSTVPLLVSAKITRNNGKISSNIVAVTVPEGDGMNIGMSWPSDAGPTYVQKSGVNFVWHYAAKASGQALLKSGVTVAWFLDGVQVATGAAFSQNFTGMPGTKELKVVATDTEGRTGHSLARIAFSAPTVANEPALVPTFDPGIGDMVDENGQEFAFDPLKTSNGLVVVTHGLNGDKSDQWLLNMAKDVRIRLQGEGKPLPNIAVYGWGLWSQPSEYWNMDIPYMSFAEDILLIRPHGLSLGRELADWFKVEIGRGNILTTAPVHLIGHSAGGFVVGECGYQLRSTLANVRVTMLDTPYPAWTHLAIFPGTGRRLDRYVSSLFGSLENPLSTAVEIVANKYDYVLLGLVPTPAAHSY